MSHFIFGFVFQLNHLKRIWRSWVAPWVFWDQVSPSDSLFVLLVVSSQPLDVHVFVSPR